MQEWFLSPLQSFQKAEQKESPTIIRVNEQFWDFQCLRRGNPILCLQKGILSPSCLPAFGKVVFCSLHRLILHCERDFSFAGERDSHFFDKIILPSFSLHVNHVKLFHLVVFDLRSVRDPGTFALPRCAPQGGCDKGLDDGLMGVLMGVLMDGIEWWVTSVFWRINFEAIEGILTCRRTWLLLIRAVHCCLFAQSLLCLCSPMLFFCWNFTGCNFGLWNKKQVYYCSI